MLQVFYLLRMFCNGFQVSFRCFCECYRHMFQMLHLDVSKVDRGVLHMLQPAAAVGCARGHAGRRRRAGSGEGANAAWSRVGRSRCGG